MDVGVVIVLVLLVLLGLAARSEPPAAPPIVIVQQQPPPGPGIGELLLRFVLIGLFLWLIAGIAMSAAR
ncbi:MAG: hypothetical protein OHK0015_40450 [Chloroflexi bacterium OHK40]